ncbi:DNA-binding response regulator [Prevotella sp. P6B1]|uniref:response regulator transcription factor n=1 Tax=Prevotella sp. P6B1 TaxID=1410613 RepID=UPI00051B9F39|nr:DNA-binding response regulator [Prevotella sp. P6B1]
MILWFSILLNVVLVIAIARFHIKNRQLLSIVPMTAEAVKEIPSNTKKKILLIGMDEETETDLKANLQMDYDLIFIKNGQQAISMIEDIKIDLIISEYLMQEMSGDELCHAIRANTGTCTIPVVFLSSLSHSADIVYGLEAGARDYITKPYDITILKARIDIVLSEHHDGNMHADEPQSVNNLQDLEFLQRLDKVIRVHLSNSYLQINDICKEMGMSRTAMFNKVKAVTGHSPNDYLRIYRLNESKRLLEAKLWTIAEVAIKVGYNDPKYFSTCFKKQFGYSPSKIIK